MKFEVRVELKANVFDVEAREILSSLKSNGYSIDSVKTAKVFVINVTGPNPEATALDAVRNILSNGVTETFSIKKIDD